MGSRVMPEEDNRVGLKPEPLGDWEGMINANKITGKVAVIRSNPVAEDGFGFGTEIAPELKENLMNPEKGAQPRGKVVLKLTGRKDVEYWEAPKKAARSNCAEMAVSGEEYRVVRKVTTVIPKRRKSVKRMMYESIRESIKSILRRRPSTVAETP